MTLLLNSSLPRDSTSQLTPTRCPIHPEQYTTLIISTSSTFTRTTNSCKPPRADCFEQDLECKNRPMEVEAGLQSIAERSAGNTAQRTKQRLLAKPTLLLLIGFSVIYFADMLLRASEKYWWYD